MELPISKCMKEYYEKKRTVFTDAEQSTIFWNSDLPLSDKLNALQEILDTTRDEGLKQQIRQRLDAEKATQESFMYCDNDYVHLVFLDDSDDADRVFSSVHTAIEFGITECDETFRIDKEVLDDQLASNTDKRTLLGGRAVFQKDGTLISCDCYNSREIEFTFLNTVEPSGFEEAYIPVLNPFEYGDIVQVMGDDRPAIVVTSQNSWNDTLERLRKTGLPLNYYTNTLTVEYLYPDGEFAHGHPDILSLEKVEQWNNDEEWNLLQAISKLMKGHGWPEEVFEHYKANKR